VRPYCGYAGLAVIRDAWTVNRAVRSERRAEGLRLRPGSVIRTCCTCEYKGASPLG